MVVTVRWGAALLLTATLLLLATNDAGAAVTARISGDTLRVTGDGKADAVTVRLRGRAVVVRGRRFDRSRFRAIAVLGRGGNDRLRVVGDLNERTTLDGGRGNDRLTGGPGRERLVGGAGRDSVDGGRGRDDVRLGAGDDTFASGAGDGADRVDGQGGRDRLRIAGSSAGEQLRLSAAGERLRVTRGRARFDAAGFEAVGVRALGGSDTVTLDDLAGTGVTAAAVDLAGRQRKTADGTPDSVIVNGSSAADNLTVAGGTDFGVRGLAATVVGSSPDNGSDRFIVNGLGGADTISAAFHLGLALTVDGGAGADSLTGSDGADTLLGGDDDDTVDGGRGNDVVTLGAGADSARWSRRGGADVVEGGTGSDRLLLSGDHSNEYVELAGNGGRLRAIHDVATPTLDADDVENVDVDTLGGADTVVFGDLGATDVDRADVDLAGPAGAGDGRVDTVTVAAGAGADQMTIAGNAGGLTVGATGALVAIAHAEPTDGLIVNGAGGDDFLDARGLAAGFVALTLNGGEQSDVVMGSPGADTLRSDPGAGTDVVEGQAGNDELLVVGSEAADTLGVSTDGARVRVARDGSPTLDASDAEAVFVYPLGGADGVDVGDLAGTDATSVRVDLAARIGAVGGDGHGEHVTVAGTGAGDVVAAAPSGMGATVSGLPAPVTLANADAPGDWLTISALGGDDVVDASGIPTGVIALTIDGGVGADVLLGSAGTDHLEGGDGDDVALMGAGNDTFRWDPGDDNDTLEGQAGLDRMAFNGAAVGESVDLSANGGRLRFVRDVASVTMDLNDVEIVQYEALGGADTFTVGDLAGTDAVRASVDLGAADGAADNVVVNGTNGDDDAAVEGSTPLMFSAAMMFVTGLDPIVAIEGAEAATDRLTVNLLGGDDVIDASGVAPGSIALTLTGGIGDDILIGGDGDDTINGGDDDDELYGGPGVDVLDGGPGTDIEIQD